MSRSAASKEANRIYAKKKYYTDGKRAERRVWLQALKENHPCVDCGVVYHPVVMDFHHRDPASKLFNIGRKWGSTSISLLLEEIAKCDLICANCHRLRTHHE